MLNNVEFNAYVQRTIQFCRTMVIKCEDLALLDNTLMETEQGVVIDNDKAKWRYYLNLYGEYHSTDEMMQVQSLDNGELIDFTKANLDIHLATKRAYRQGSYYYTRLLEKYPGQLILINGIINPIPPSESIPAKDYEILRFNKDFVLWNEYQLIPALQQHIYSMVGMSFKTEYLFTDNLMLPTLLANLYGSLVSAVCMIREDAKGTRNAHEFHIWSKLASLGLSPIYKQVLDNKQTMWLYRNLEYVLRKQGRKKTFDELVEIILTHRQIPLARHEVLQTTKNQLDTLVPEPAFLSRPVNLLNEFGMNTRLISVEELIRKEIPTAMDNENNIELNQEAADYKIRFGLHSDIPTKVLESIMVDATDRNPENMMKVLHNHWIYLSHNDVYNVNHDITDVRTGRHFRVTTKQAYILWAWLIDRYKGSSQEFIPEYTYYRARKITPPNYQVLMSLGHKDILTEELCKDILNVKVDFPRIISPDVFYLKCKEIFDRSWDHKKLYSRILNLFIQSRTQNAVDACYETGTAKLTDIPRYSDWLAKLDLSFEDYGQEDLLDLAWAIWVKVTGWDTVQMVTVSDQQRYLINLMKDLTSYTVQYIGTTDQSVGQYQLGHMSMVDTDWWSNLGETGLEADNKDQIIPGHNKGLPEAVLEEVYGPFSVEGNMVDHVHAESIGCGRIELGVNLYMEQYQPEPAPSHLADGLTLREEPDSRG